MTFDNYTRILLSGASISLGAFLGILRSKIFSSKIKTTLYYSFYVVALLIILIAIVSLVASWSDYFNPVNLYGVIVLSSSIIASIALIVVTKMFLITKDIYHSSELDPIVNNFTSNADRQEIKLFGGDLSFFGNSSEEINKNSQYTHLRSIGFTRILILCETPVNNTQRMRYGKILSEMQGVELKFYDPEEADLRVRGRIIKVNAVVKLLIYDKIKSQTYRTIESDTSNSNGALYNDIWNLVWKTAAEPSDHDIISYKEIYNGK